MITFVFPGQGAQYSGMGQALMDHFPQELATADRIIGGSARTLCSSDDAVLRQTENTQPALYLINALFLKNAQRMGLHPSMTAGHSLGELNALQAAGVFDFETGLRIAVERGKAMGSAEENPFQGGMVAATSVSDLAKLEAFMASQFPEFDIATRNSPSQVGLSGPREKLKELCEALHAEGLARAIVLNVGCAFHSRYIEPSTHRFRNWLETAPLQIEAPRFDVISNVTAAPFPKERQEIIELLVQSLISPVRWLETVQTIAQRGHVLFHELGPRSVLTHLIKDVFAAERAES
ncbi:Polyketide biosynthesis protein BaeE [Pseudovibrio axinellae]|uniref:Malonyl CoA-acyl carrier protein transacylase n=1 Tax=Pseudovibrio axinellae TaxID=989403 RepID=A0A165U0P2_9HYPH|nr:acyltransferase domain-containing protein [Pseudovibrio axinellae]KZL09099.1 Polyketide biosynthesis protein BaeE [Pseudovibrio axinellae]SER75305.1 trans-AT polyketide synthase, acyltransferase and oxidoreductase domain-containing protein [Pseudovibrio axinellae]